jgi:hypothetical protein
MIHPPRDRVQEGTRHELGRCLRPGLSGASVLRTALLRRVKLLSPTAIAQADGACGIFAMCPFRRLTARLPGPKLCLSPQPHQVRHELRPPALATTDRHPGSGRPPGRRITPSLGPRRVGSFPSITTGPCCVDPAGRRGFRDPQGEKTPPILPFTTPTESDQRPRVCRRDAPNADERFCRQIRPADDVFGTHRE